MFPSHLKDIDVTLTGREVRLARRPTGLPGLEHFAVVEVPVPQPGDGEVLVRNLWFRLSASIRMMISEGAEAVEGVPFPAIGIGDPLAEDAIGEVVAAPAGSGLTPGDLLCHVKGWRDYALLKVGEGRRVDPAVPDPTLALSHGWTAYAALTRAVTVGRGETVFVSSAAGAIGSMAGQIARQLGAGRVIGSTSTRAKARRLVEELGYTAAVCREAGPIEDQLRRAAPDGIDITLDMTGGDQLAAAVSVAAPKGRIIVLGALSGQLAPDGTGRVAPVTLDSFQLLVKALSLKGYSADDDPDAVPEWEQRSGAWLRNGAIRFAKTTVQGLDRAPAALAEVSRGDHFGVTIVEL